MKTCNFYLTLLFVVLTFQSCSNEIPVLADYEENASIFGLIDPSQSVQFIKINKVFTNPNVPASTVARISDSLYFDTLTPSLTELETGKVIPLTRANVLLKDSGYFASSPNYLYATKTRLSHKYRYRLDMRLPGTNKYVSATTNVSDSIRLYSPVSLLVKPAAMEIFIDGKVVISFQSPLNSKIYDGYFFFNYLEVNKADTNIKVVKTLKWRLFNKLRADNDQAPQPFTLRIASTSFYDLLLAQIPVDNSIERRFLPCKVEITAGNLELDNYIQATEPSIGIVQKQTEYTNISYGIGIFASRRLTSYNNINLGTTTRATILAGDYKKLGFVN